MELHGVEGSERVVELGGSPPKSVAEVSRSQKGGENFKGREHKFGSPCASTRTRSPVKEGRLGTATVARAGMEAYRASVPETGSLST